MDQCDLPKFSRLYSPLCPHYRTLPPPYHYWDGDRWATTAGRRENIEISCKRCAPPLCNNFLPFEFPQNSMHRGTVSNAVDGECSVEEEEEDAMWRRRRRRKKWKRARHGERAAAQRFTLHCIVILWRIYLFIIPNICWGNSCSASSVRPRAWPNDIYCNDNAARSFYKP